MSTRNQAKTEDVRFRVPRRPGDVAISQAEVARARELLGFEARLDIDDMCRSSWHWMKTGATLGESASHDATSDTE